MQMKVDFDKQAHFWVGLVICKATHTPEVIAEYQAMQTSVEE
jgi:hypothetical protein